MAESGFPGFEAISWFGLFAPARTPPAVTGKLYQEALKVLAEPDMREQFAKLGLDPAGAPGSELGAIIKSDLEKWAKVIKDANITIGN